MCMGIGLSEWHCRPESSISEEIRLLAISAQHKHFLLIFHHFTVNGMALRVLRSKPSECATSLTSLSQSFKSLT